MRTLAVVVLAGIVTPAFAEQPRVMRGETIIIRDHALVAITVLVPFAFAPLIEGLKLLPQLARIASANNRIVRTIQRSASGSGVRRRASGRTA